MIIGLTARPTSSTAQYLTISHRAGFRVDLDLADMGAEREARVRHHLVAGRGKRAAQILRQVGARRRIAAATSNRPMRLIRAGHGEAPSG